VQNLLFVPRFFFTESIIQKRKPLSEHARRAGWVGCNILLGEIPSDGKLWLVSNGLETRASDVRKQFERMRPLERLDAHLRGWTLNVLKIVRKIGRKEFSLSEAYLFAPELARIYPHNRYIRHKIRQQLQVLRDLGVLKFTGRGHYSLDT